MCLQGKELLAFERYLVLRKAGGNHAHVNVLPIPAAAAKQAQQVSLCIATLHASLDLLARCHNRLSGIAFLHLLSLSLGFHAAYMLL